MKRYWFLAFGLLLIGYAAYFNNLAVFVAHPERISYLRYDNTIREIARLAILLMFALIFVARPASTNPDDLARRRVSGWNLGFWGAFLMVVGLIVYVNPHGMFSWQFLDSSSTMAAYVPTAARSDKVTLFNKLEDTPDILILGSSRAITIPAARVLENTGRPTFNMAVNGGGPLDFITFGRFVLSQEETPQVLIVELVEPGLDIEDKPMPITMMPYLDADKKLETADTVFRDVVSLQSLSDTVYQLTYARLSQRPPPVMVFLPDGSGVRAEIAEESYRAAFLRVAQNLNRTNKCRQLNEQGMARLEGLAALALETKTALLFYRSPISAEYWEVKGSDHPDIARCESLFLAFISDLTTMYPNLFFRDLTRYEPVASLGWEGFYDIHHLKPNAAQLVVDELTPEIIKAIDWASAERIRVEGQ